MISKESSNKKYQIDALDGLRGVAVLVVILAHTSNAGYHLMPFIDFSGAGHSGVFLFFVLSAYLLTYPFISREQDAFSLSRLGIYFERRFFRIYPLYFLYLTVGLLTTAFLAMVVKSKPVGIPFALTFPEYVDHLLMVYGKEVTWSIPVEFKYYFLLPIVAFVMAVILKRGLVISAIFIALVIYFTESIWPLNEAISIRSLVYYLPVFLSGSMLAVAHHVWIKRGLTNNPRVALLLECSGLIAFAMIVLLTPSLLIYFGFDPSQFKPHRQFLLFSLLWSLVVFAAIHGSGLFKNIFEFPALRFLGFISFSAYLFHPIFIRVVEHSAIGRTIHPTLSGWLILACTMMSAWLSFVLIERPASRLSLVSHISNQLKARVRP